MNSLPNNKISPENLDKIFTVLGLTKTEKEVLSALSKMAKPVSVISRHTKISRNSLLYILAKLEKRLLIKKIMRNEKKYDRIYWKSDIEKAIRTIKLLSFIPPNTPQ